MAIAFSKRWHLTLENIPFLTGEKLICRALASGAFTQESVEVMNDRVSARPSEKGLAGEGGVVAERVPGGVRGKKEASFLVPPLRFYFCLPTNPYVYQLITPNSTRR